MKLVYAILAMLAAFQPGVARAAPTDDAKPAIVALAHRVIDALNRGDTATVKALAPAESIIDELPPFNWRGPGATDAWLAAVRREGARTRTTNVLTILDPPSHIRIEGDTAYAAFPDRLSFTQDGVRVDKRGIWTIVAARSGDGWRITAWAYSAGAD